MLYSVHGDWTWTMAKPGCSIASDIMADIGRTWLDIVEAMYETPMLRYIWNGLSFSSALPNGVELVTTPSSVVGELWPLVRP